MTPCSFNSVTPCLVFLLHIPDKPKFISTLLHMGDFDVFSVSDECSVYEGALKVNFFVLVLITFGIFISYVPQYRRIIIKRTSEGLSTNFLLLGSCSSLFTLTNIILVSLLARVCCYLGELSSFNCLNSQLNLVQISVQSVSAILILVLVLVFTKHSIKQDKDEYRRIENVGKVVAVHGMLSLCQLVWGLEGSKTTLFSIANVNGLLSTLLTVIKYVPQIHTTYKLKHPGTLSVGMMRIQTPGGAIFALTLFLSKGSHWSSWFSYFVAVCLQGTLLGLCTYYEYFKEDGLTSEISERRALERIIQENVTEETALVDDLPANQSQRA